MQKWDTVAIYGVGLIGGAIGLALRERKLAGRVIGLGRRRETLELAQQRGAVDAVATDFAALGDAQLVVLAMPVEQIAPAARAIVPFLSAGTLLTDVGSVKEQLVADLAPQIPSFVGSHPLAGSEKCGVENARADLFVDRTAVVTPAAENRPDDVAAIEGFWQSLGAHVLRMTPAEHDAALAATSHLPHLVASVLAAATPRNLLPLAATGFADTTRIASGDADLWRQIFMANKAHTLRALANFEKVLADFKQGLLVGDSQAIALLLEQGKAIRDSLGS